MANSVYYYILTKLKNPNFDDIWFVSASWGSNTDLPDIEKRGKYTICLKLVCSIIILDTSDSASAAQQIMA